MRIIALIVALTCCTSNATAAQWLTLEAHACASTSAGPAPIYSPDMTVEAYNGLLASRDQDQFRLVAVTVSADQLSPRKLVDRPIEFHAGDAVYHGRVSSVFIESTESTGRQLRVLAWVENQRSNGVWRLSTSVPGRLKIQL
ncbi:MAG: hypothetical protein R3C53_22715 [Pirellulaceae bacterium]